MSGPRFVWPKQEATYISQAHIIKDPYVPFNGRTGVQSYCGIWYAWGEFDGNAYASRDRCTACLKGFMADNVVVTDGESD